MNLHHRDGTAVAVDGMTVPFRLCERAAADRRATRVGARHPGHSDLATAFDRARLLFSEGRICSGGE
jgi:hypothetical protein